MSYRLFNNNRCIAHIVSVTYFRVKNVNEVHKQKSDRSRFKCPGTELNRYDRCGSQDFKSCVSTNSTTGAAIEKKSRQKRDKFLSERPGSNRPPRPWQGRALPNELLSLISVRTIFRECKNRILHLSTKFLLLNFICTAAYIKYCPVLPLPAFLYTGDHTIQSSHPAKKPQQQKPAYKKENVMKLPSYNRILCLCNFPFRLTCLKNCSAKIRLNLK